MNLRRSGAPRGRTRIATPDAPVRSSAGASVFERTPTKPPLLRVVTSPRHVRAALSNDDELAPPITTSSSGKSSSAPKLSPGATARGSDFGFGSSDGSSMNSDDCLTKRFQSHGTRSSFGVSGDVRPGTCCSSGTSGRDSQPPSSSAAATRRRARRAVGCVGVSGGAKEVVAVAKRSICHEIPLRGSRAERVLALHGEERGAQRGAASRLPRGAPTSTAPHQTSHRNVCNERSRWRGPRRAVGGVGKSVTASR